MGGVGGFISHVGDLRLNGAAQVRVEIHVPAVVVFGLMLGDPFKGLVTEVQSVEALVALFQFGDDAQGVPVMVEGAVIFHLSGQHFFSRMSKGRVPQVVGEADGFRQVFIAAQRPGEGPADLRDFQRMGQPGAVVVSLIIDEDLGLVFQPPEGSGVQDAVLVALVAAAVAVFFFGIQTPAGVFGMRPVRGDDHLFFSKQIGRRRVIHGSST